VVLVLSVVTRSSLSLIITLHAQVPDQILMVVVVVHADLTLAPMRVGAAGLRLEVYSIRFLVGSAIITATVTMTALGLDTTVGVDPILIQCQRQHREGIGMTMATMIVTSLELGRRTSISSGK